MTLLCVEHLKKQFSKRCVVNDVSLRVDAGEIVGLLGRNGAGKTTTFRMVVGLLKPDDGNVILQDNDISQLPMYKRARLGLGYLSQEPSIFRRLTVVQNILAVLETMKLKNVNLRDRAMELLERFGLADLADSMAESLSGGERRRLEITRALVNEPTLILLDEPFAGVDPIAVSNIQKMIEQLRDSGIGMLLTDHNVRETLAITDRSYILNDGKVEVEGTPQEIIDSEFARKHYLGVDFKL